MSWRTRARQQVAAQQPETLERLIERYPVDPYAPFRRPVGEQAANYYRPALDDWQLAALKALPADELRELVRATTDGLRGPGRDGDIDHPPRGSLLWSEIAAGLQFLRDNALARRSVGRGRAHSPRTTAKVALHQALGMFYTNHAQACAAALHAIETVGLAGLVGLLQKDAHCLGILRPQTDQRALVRTILQHGRFLAPLRIGLLTSAVSAPPQSVIEARAAAQFGEELGRYSGIFLLSIEILDERNGALTRTWRFLPAVDDPQRPLMVELPHIDREQVAAIWRTCEASRSGLWVR